MSEYKTIAPEVGHYYVGADGSSLIYIDAIHHCPVYEPPYPVHGYTLIDEEGRQRSKPIEHDWARDGRHERVGSSPYDIVRDLGTSIERGSDGKFIIPPAADVNSVNAPQYPDTFPDGYLLVASDPCVAQRGDIVWGRYSDEEDILPHAWMECPPALWGHQIKLRGVLARRSVATIEPPREVSTHPLLAAVQWDILPPHSKFRKGDMRYQLDSSVPGGEWRLGPKNEKDPLYGQTLAEAQARLPSMGILAFARRRPIPTCDFRVPDRDNRTHIPSGKPALEQRFILADGSSAWLSPPFVSECPPKAHID